MDYILKRANDPVPVRSLILISRRPFVHVLDSVRYMHAASVFSVIEGSLEVFTFTACKL
jgi:hypothetical protein